MLQWTFDRPQRGAGDVAVVRRGIQLLVTQQHLDHPDVHLLLQEVGRKAMPQCVQTDALAYAGGLLGGVKSAIQLARGQRSDRVAARSSQPPGSITLRSRPARHQARRISSRGSDSMA